MTCAPASASRLSASICLVAILLTSAAFAQTLTPAVTPANAGAFMGAQWPADFNNDGRTDLAASSTTQHVQVVLGNGDGTFGAPIATGVPGRPLATADLDRDGNRDIIAGTNDGMAVLPGNGNGTFDAPIVIGRDGDARITLVADMDGDGHLDVMSAADSWMSDVSLDVLPGNGDFTFDEPIAITWVLNGFGGMVVDLNGDGRRDIIIGQLFGGPNVPVLINEGNFVFTRTEVASQTDEGVSGVTARDVTGDGVIDLIIASRMEQREYSFGSGAISVARGNGDGTFSPAGVYPAVRGAGSVAVGDFTHDGILDIAAKNQSRYINNGICGTAIQNGESVSIFAGRGDGTFHTPVSFATEPQGMHDYVSFWGPTLNTSDVNGDRFPDLIVGNGKVFITLGPRANRPPVVTAEPDYTSTWGPDLHLLSTASDPDHHFLDFAWSGGSGGTMWDADQPRGCYEADYAGYGEYHFTVTVSDRAGGVASDDLTVTYASPSAPPQVRFLSPSEGEAITAGIPYTVRWEASDNEGLESFFLRYEVGSTTYHIDECGSDGTRRECVWRNPGPAGSSGRLVLQAWDNTGTLGRATVNISVAEPWLPAGWTGTDIGAVGRPGSSSHTAGTYTVTGSGADIWGTADEFHYVYRTMRGDFDLVTRVTSVEHVHVWTKAGLMIRESLAAGARHASLFATPSNAKGLAFQRRTATDGTSVHTAGPALAPGVWLRLQRVGNTVTAFFHIEGNPVWTRIGSPQLFTALPEALLVGLAVTSHDNTRTASGTFDNVAITQLFSSRDIGSVGVAGTTTVSGNRVTLEGSGGDIWGTADAFRFHYVPWEGNGSITVRATSIEQTHAWAKAGIMFRESLNANAKQAIALVSAAKGLAVQYRSTTGGITENATLSPGAAPEWLRLTRMGDSFVAEVSEDGATWRWLGSVSFPMASQVYVGLAVTSHANGTLATGVFDGLTVYR